MLRRVAIVIGGVVALWLIALAILGAVFGSRQRTATTERLAQSLQAQVSIGTCDLALVRGRLTLDNVAIRRDDTVGHLAVDVSNVRCELAPLGWALVDRDCSELAVRGVRVEISTASLFKMQQQPKRPPIRADKVVIDDAVFVFLPNAFVPNLGRVEISIDHAVAGPTRMRSSLSWLLSLQELTAHLSLPANMTVQLTYKAGMLTVAGSVFGSKPVTMPVQLPVQEQAHDAHEEIQLLVQAGKDIAERLVAQRATDWLKSKLH